MLMKALLALFPIVSAICALIAARYAWRAAMIPPYPAWTPAGHPGSSEPVVPELVQAERIDATTDAVRTGGDLNVVAVRWTIAAVLLSAVGGVLGVLL